MDRDDRAQSVPGSRETSTTRQMPMNKNIESVGNLSRSSAQTFVHEDSTLVVECQENDAKK